MKKDVRIGLLVIALVLVLSVMVTFLETKNYYERPAEIEQEQRYETQCVGNDFALIDNELLVCVPQEYLSDFYCEVRI